MIVGTFTKTETGSFVGNVETLTFAADLVVEPAEKSAERAPDYRVHVRHSGMEIGAAWNEKSQRSGEPYISIKIDDPSFAYPMWAALTKSDEGFALKWSRPRRKADPDTSPDTSDEDTL